jgi:hypothetical protein
MPRPPPRRYPIPMIKALALLLAASPAFSTETPAMAQLMRLSGYETVPYVAPVKAAPVRMAGAGELRASNDPLERTTVVCTMDIEYRETVSQLIIVRVWKQLDGTAVIRCNNLAPITLLMRGEGLSLGLGLPNESPFRSTHGVMAGNLSIRLPALFVPHQLEGTYHNLGGEVLGAGLSFSPWVNTDGSFQTTLYLPTSFNASAAINLQTLTLRLPR